MKNNLNNTAIGLAVALLLSATGHASVSGINSPGNSNATIRFGDTLSGAGGGIYSPPVANPWNGVLYTTPFYTDGTTLDTAQGSISASFTPATYAINIDSRDDTSTNRQNALCAWIPSYVLQYGVQRVEINGRPVVPEEVHLRRALSGRRRS